MFQNLRALIIFAGLVAALFGCSAAGPKFDASQMEPISTASSHIYIFRESEFFQSGSYPMIKIDGKEVGALRNGGYIVAKIEPGSHKILVAWGGPPTRFKISTEGGKRHYVRVGIETISVTGSSIYSRIAISEIPEPKALAAMGALKLSE